MIKFIFVGSAGVVIMSSDNGDSWVEKNEGLNNPGIFSFTIHGDYIFAADIFYGIFRAKLSDFGITEVREQNNNTNSGFESILILLLKKLN